MRRILSILAVLLFGAAATAQTIAPDPAFRVGKLDNGMTYYLCHNANPAGCADFYIAHNVGALQEEDNQNGLAHFLEHMAFNGTRHYPGKGILEFLAKDGVRFGYNVNAYTSKRETVYNLSSVPLVRESFIDSVLLVLHDWSCDISCEQQALDDERGVISEEWRLRDDPRSRMAELQNKLVFKGAKQAERNVIGTLEVINGFKREEILDFYHKWYRPDLQAIVVVGDFDMDEMEARVRRCFSDIPAAVNPTPKEHYFPPRLEEPLFEDITDSRFKFNAFKIFYKQPYPDAEGRMSEEFFRDLYCRQIISAALGERLRRACLRPDAPARSAVLVTSEYEPDFFISLFTITPKSKDLLLESAGFTHRAICRLLRYGISEQEFEVAKLATAQRYRLDRPLEREEVKNSDLVNTAVYHFLKSHPLVNPVDLQDLQARILSEIRYQDVAAYPEMMFAESEVIYSSVYNDVEEPGIAPTPEQIKDKIAAVEAEPLQPAFVEYPVLNMDVDVPRGTVVKASAKKGIEVWTLSNGVKVYYKKAVPVKSNYHLSMTWRFDTGMKTYPQDNIDAARYAASFDSRFLGFRGCDKTEFKNYPELSGISVIVSPGQKSSQIEMLAGKGKEENAFKVAHLMLMEPYFGTDIQLEKSKADNLKSLSRKKSKRIVFEERCTRELYGDHPWLHPLDSAAVEAVDQTLVREIFNRAFGDFSRLSVFICSDLDRNQVGDYVRKYVATLGGDYIWKDSKAKAPKSVLKGYNVISEVNEPDSEPLSAICYTFYAKVKTDTKSRVVSEYLDYILSARYLDLIREERGGAYHVGYSSVIPDDPALPWHGVVQFQTRPEMEDILLQDVKDVMDKMSSEGPTAEEMEVARKYLVKRHGEVEHRVSMSISQQKDRLINTVLWGRDYDYDHAKVIGSVKASDVMKLARRMNSGDIVVEVYTEK